MGTTFWSSLNSYERYLELRGSFTLKLLRSTSGEKKKTCTNIFRDKRLINTFQINKFIIAVA